MLYADIYLRVTATTTMATTTASTTTTTTSKINRSPPFPLFENAMTIDSCDCCARPYLHTHTHHFGRRITPEPTLKKVLYQCGYFRYPHMYTAVAPSLALLHTDSPVLRCVRRVDVREVGNRERQDDKVLGPERRSRRTARRL